MLYQCSHLSESNFNDKTNKSKSVIKLFWPLTKFRSFVKNDSTTENCQSSGRFWLLKLQNQLPGGCSVKNVILKYFVEFRDLQLFLKTKLRHRHFPVNFANFSEELFRRISANVCIWNLVKGELFHTFTGNRLSYFTKFSN